MSLKQVFKQYSKLEKPILLIILTEFFIQFINITFMNIQPLFMEAANYSIRICLSNVNLCAAFVWNTLLLVRSVKFNNNLFEYIINIYLIHIKNVGS
jgi:hypothetical protein